MKEAIRYDEDDKASARDGVVRKKERKSRRGSRRKGGRK